MLGILFPSVLVFLVLCCLLSFFQSHPCFHYLDSIFPSPTCFSFLRSINLFPVVTVFISFLLFSFPLFPYLILRFVLSVSNLVYVSFTLIPCFHLSFASSFPLFFSSLPCCHCIYTILSIPFPSLTISHYVFCRLSFCQDSFMFPLL